MSDLVLSDGASKGKLWYFETAIINDGVYNFWFIGIVDGWVRDPRNGFLLGVHLIDVMKIGSRQDNIFLKISELINLYNDSYTLRYITHVKFPRITLYLDKVLFDCHLVEEEIEKEKEANEE